MINQFTVYLLLNDYCTGLLTWNNQNVSRPGPVPGPESGAAPGIPPQGAPQPPPGPQQNMPGYPTPPFPGGPFPPYGQRFGPPPGQFPPGPGFPPYGAPPGWLPPPGHGFPPGPGQFPPNMAMGAPGQMLPQQQRPGPPGVPPVPQPTSELPVGDKVPSNPATPAQHAPTPPVDSKPSVNEAVQVATAPVPGGAQKNGRVVPAIPIAAPKPAAPGAAGAVAQGGVLDATAAATAAVAAAMAKLPQPGGPKKPTQGDASVDNVTRKMNDLRPYDNARPSRGGHQQQGPRGGRGGARNQQKKFEVPESDYDFETANAKFNKQDLVKEAIASGSPTAEVEALQAEAEAGDPAASSVPPHSVPNLYNRTASFFDNISSEARDREENITVRAGGREWRGEEEKRNIETFGQGSVDGYRGRGRGRGRGGRGYNRGYGGRGYGGRGRGGVRGGRGNSQATGVPSLG